MRDEEILSLKFGLRFLAYLPWLMLELIKSGIEISLCIVNSSAKITPRVIKIKPSQRTSTGLMIYANSITFTPGTVSTLVSNEEIEVHTITDNAEKDLINGVMNGKVKAIEEII
jgi:multicomponent Na+:H+ antiporter subunit E